MSENESLCQRCAQHMRTCCQTREIYVTLGDVDRINTFGNHQNFFEYRPPSDPSYLNQEDDPTWARCVLGPRGRRRVLKRRANGDCLFLGSRGCGLPLEVRPLVCRLYPFDYNEQGIKDEPAAGCPIHLLSPGQELLTVLDMKLPLARQWHEQLYREIRMKRKPQCSLV